jgi:hypothetical protein
MLKIILKNKKYYFDIFPKKNHFVTIATFSNFPYLFKNEFQTIFLKFRSFYI